MYMFFRKIISLPEYSSKICLIVTKKGPNLTSSPSFVNLGCLYCGSRAFSANRISNTRMTCR